MSDLITSLEQAGEGSRESAWSLTDAQWLAILGGSVARVRLRIAAILRTTNLEQPNV